MPSENNLGSLSEVDNNNNINKKKESHTDRKSSTILVMDTKVILMTNVFR